jgi:hypothetical protein
MKASLIEKEGIVKLKLIALNTINSLSFDKNYTKKRLKR